MTDKTSGVAPGAPADRTLTVNGLPVHYLDWGTQGAQPLVLLHGIARVARTFDHLAPHFARDYHVIAMDLRGHGDSGWDPQGHYLVEDYTSDLAGLVATLGLRDIVLWGNSTGGRVAQVYAGTHPALVSAVIVEDVGPERPAAISNRRASRMSVEAAGWTCTDALFAEVKAAHPRTPDAVLRNLVEHGSRRDERGRVVWKRDPAILNGFVPTELWASVAAIRAPIVYILGGASTIVPPETQARLKAVLPQVEIVTLPELGHYPSDEAPETFLALADRFLAAAARR